MNFVYESELIHAGRKGMKWGQRLYQNKDGSLTPLGRIHYRKMKQAAAKKEVSERKAAEKKAKAASEESEKEAVKKVLASRKKSVLTMSDEELKSSIARLQLEQQYRQLNPEKVSLAKQFINESVIPASIEGSKRALTDYIGGLGKKLSEGKAGDDPTSKLKSEISKLKLDKEYQDLTDYLSKETSALRVQAQIEKYKSEIRKSQKDLEDKDDK